MVVFVSRSRGFFLLSGPLVRPNRKKSEGAEHEPADAAAIESRFVGVQRGMEVIWAKLNELSSTRPAPSPEPKKREPEWLSPLEALVRFNPDITQKIHQQQSLLNAAQEEWNAARAEYNPYRDEPDNAANAGYSAAKRRVTDTQNGLSILLTERLRNWWMS